MLTCRHIYNETRNIYKANSRSFWTTGDFVLDLNHAQAVEWFAAQNVQDFEHINKLQVNLRSITWDLLDRRGGWLCRNMGYRHLVYFGWKEDGRWSGHFGLTETGLEQCYAQGMEGVPFHDLVKETWRLGQ